MTHKTLSNNLTAAFFALAFSAAFLLSAVGPAINFASVGNTAQTHVA